MHTISLTLSEAAKTHYRRWLNGQPTAIGIRLFTERAGCSGLKYRSDLLMETSPDAVLVFEEDGLNVFMSKVSIPYLNGIHIDVEQQQLGQSQVTYRNPNEVARCGCGESFKVKDQ